MNTDKIKTHLHFCYDRLTESGKGYPNLAKENLTWKEWDFHWPKTVAIRLLEFLKNNNYDYQESMVDTAPPNSWYPIGISWFDFDCDYINLIPKATVELIRNKKFKILFYYHEGDNPYRISQRLNALCIKHSLPDDCYVFISANTAANNIENFIYFNDHESFFANINRFQSSDVALNIKKPHDFSMLSRTHKWWRATCLYDSLRNNFLDNSIWSYHSNCDIGESLNDNPIDLSVIGIPQSTLIEFVDGGPYLYDNDVQNHNSHRKVNVDVFKNSYFNLILETHLDADQSGGAFLTEKTFKPIKFGQPFVMIGTPNSLKLLRSMGYRTFDNFIDNNYDSIEDNTKRWIAIKKTIHQIIQQKPKDVYTQCYDDIIHNQHHFSNRIKENINYIVNKLNCKQ